MTGDIGQFTTSTELEVKTGAEEEGSREPRDATSRATSERAGRRAVREWLPGPGRARETDTGLSRVSSLPVVGPRALVEEIGGEGVRRRLDTAQVWLPATADAG
jgi:hypothetical protein